jgi:hypothetical protein
MKYLRKVTFDNCNTIADYVAKSISQTRPELRNSPQVNLRNLWDQDPTGKTIPESLVPADMNKEFTRRFNRVIELHGKKAKFDQCKLSDQLTTELDSLLPTVLRQQQHRYTVQFLYDGNQVTPHKDQLRRCSLFYLFTEPNAETTWWVKKEEFKEYDNLRYGDIDRLEKAHTEIIEQNQWYLFNQEEYHSVQLLPDAPKNRVSVLIEFPDLSADQIYELLYA